MERVGIYWTKPGTMECDFDKPPPYPSFNAMAAVMDTFTSQYVTKGKADAFWERYAAATQEITQAYNDMQSQNRELQKRVAELEAGIKKWTSQQGKGKRPNKKIYERLVDVQSWKEAGVSNREIARRLGVSEGTVRNLCLQLDNRRADTTKIPN